MRRKVLVVLSLIILAAVSWRMLHPSVKASTEKFRIESRDLKITTSISGRVRAHREVALSFPISGRIIQVASNSTEVKEGEVVALLESADLYSAYLASLANLNKARSSYSNAVEVKAELDATYAGREADNIVKAKLAQGRTNVEAYAAAVESAQALTNQSWANLAKVVIKAPFTGRLIESLVKVGEVVLVGSKVATLADSSSFYLEAEADELDVNLLGLEQLAQVKLDAYPNQTFEGFVAEIDSMAHTTSSGGTAFNVKIILKSDPNTVLRSGFNGEAQITRETRKDVLTVPASFIFQKDGQTLVLVEVGTKKQERRVVLGEFVEGAYEIKEGLQAGEVIVRAESK